MNVYLTPQQFADIRVRAEYSGRSIAELLRQGVEMMLTTPYKAVDSDNPKRG